MARLWQLGVQEVRPGTYFRTSSGDVTTEGAINGIVAVVYADNWGALNEVVDISPEEMNNLRDIVGDGAGYNAVYQAFLGGALTVRAVRVGTGGTRPYVNLYSSDVTTSTGSKAGALRVYAKYPSDRTFKVSVGNDLITGYKKLTIYEGDRIVESFSVARGTKEAYRMYKAIHDNGKNFTAKYLCKKADGSNNTVCKLENYTQRSFKAGTGTNPTTNVSAFSAGLDILERYDWNVIISSSNNAGVHSLLTAYVAQCYENGRFGMAVIGGLTTDPLTDSTSGGRMEYAAALNDWRVVYVLGGWKGTDGQSYGGYKAAARIAGMIAGCESNASITHLVISGAFKPLEDLTNGQMIQAEQSGCLVLSPNEDGQVWVDNAINTLVTLNNDQDAGWRKIRRTKCRFELMSRVNRTVDKLIGRLNNDAAGRATVLTAMTTIIREMIAERKLFEGSYAEEDSRYVPSGDKAFFILHIGDIDSLEKCYITYEFSYANPYAELDVATTG